MRIIGGSCRSLMFVLLFVPSLLAQIPRTISYQGVLSDNSGNPKSDGDYVLIFSFYEAETGGDPIWNESKTLNITKGLFSTSLGDQTPFGASVKFDKPYFLGIKVGDEPELTPRIALTSAGYSFSSVNSDTAKNIIDGKVVKSFNGLKDAVTLEGSGGTTVNTNGNTITISSSSSGGTGIQGIQNTDNNIDVADPNGPIATVNIKLPLNLSGSINAISSDPFTISGQSSHEVGIGVYGVGNLSGIKGASVTGIGVLGESNGSQKWGVWGQCLSGTGTVGVSEDWTGVYGKSNTGIGVWGKTTSSYAVYGESTNGTGVYGESTNETGVHGETVSGYYGVYGESPAGAGVGGESNGYGLLGKGHGTFGVGVYATSDNWYAGSFQGNVEINGTLSKSAGSFKIDHPLDPANKYLSHSFVESPDMKNIYDGVVVTDANGNSTITLPDWFETLNKDFRYQLTIVGEEFAQARISQEISNNQFSIKTDKPHIKISWQVTGIRNDPYAKTYPIIVEQQKEEFAKGKYLRPELYGQPKETGIHYVEVPEIKNRTNPNIPDMPNLKERQD